MHLPAQLKFCGANPSPALGKVDLELGILSSGYVIDVALAGRGGLVTEANIRVETVELDSSGRRQIGQRSRTTALLRDRAGDIESAVQEASAIVQGSVAKVQDKDGWQMKSVEVKFGLVLTAEAGVVLSRASAEASFEVTLTIERE